MDEKKLKDSRPNWPTALKPKLTSLLTKLIVETALNTTLATIPAMTKFMCNDSNE